MTVNGPVGSEKSVPDALVSSPNAAVVANPNTEPGTKPSAGTSAPRITTAVIAPTISPTSSGLATSPTRISAIVAQTIPQMFARSDELSAGVSPPAAK